MKPHFLIPVLAALVLPLHAVPEYFNYQGLLRDSAGEPLDNGAYTLEFNVYDASLAGNLIWGPFLFDDDTAEGHSRRVQLSNGRFNVILGPTDTAGRNLTAVFAGDAAFIEIKVDGGDPILPRQRILSTPYAFSSATAATLEYVAPVHYRNPPGMIVPFAGRVDSIPQGWLLCDGSEFETSAYPELFATVGKIWGSTGETTFKVPDMRGMFLRGANNGRSDGFADHGAGSRQDALGQASEDAGSLQAESLAEHRHIWAYCNGGSNYMDSWTSTGSSSRFLQREGELQIENGIGSPDFSDNFNDIQGTRNLYTKPGSTTGDTGSVDPGETRPNNAAVNYIIKY